MNRFKLIAEQLANAPFRECMLAQNLASGHPTSTVSNYMKGECGRCAGESWRARQHRRDRVVAAPWRPLRPLGQGAARPQGRE